MSPREGVNLAKSIPATDAAMVAAYAGYDPFEGDRDGGVTCRTVRIVTTRKAHTCMDPYGGKHVIPPGTLARYEQALVDGDYWGRYYTCLNCIDRARADVGLPALRPAES
jgi:hypothetical protein